jgi:serine/threonine protein kinase
MEYMSGGSLFNALHSKQEINWPTRYRITADIAKGLAFLHESKILHRDLKSFNVLLSEDWHAKLTDFGLSKIKTETASTSTVGSKGTCVGWLQNF